MFTIQRKNLMTTIILLVIASSTLDIQSVPEQEPLKIEKNSKALGEYEFYTMIECAYVPHSNPKPYVACTDSDHICYFNDVRLLNKGDVHYNKQSFKDRIEYHSIGTFLDGSDTKVFAAFNPVTCIP